MLKVFRSLGRNHGRLASILCILLLLFSTTVQLSHAHPPGENHADCSLCVTAHAAVESIILPAGLVAPIARVERATPPAPRHIARLILAHPLWNRPPPASSSLA